MSISAIIYEPSERQARTASIRNRLRRYANSGMTPAQISNFLGLPVSTVVRLVSGDIVAASESLLSLLESDSLVRTMDIMEVEASRHPDTEFSACWSRDKGAKAKAIRYTGGNRHRVEGAFGRCEIGPNGTLLVRTNRGHVAAEPGDFIVRDENMKVRAMKQYLFKQLYTRKEPKDGSE